MQDSHDQEPPEPLRPGNGRSSRPGTPVPSTVLVADTGQGALYPEGWRGGPSAFLTAEDAAGLRQELAEAFGGAYAPPRDPGQAL